ncbi:hypothetical protein SLS62_011324 [Diatrype stigma]|uniref:Uncharacterized protein n=1 Tax=Diatrype stigma TaxID=117547 RepID=A0AAN9U3Q7_9PEZI
MCALIIQGVATDFAEGCRDGNILAHTNTDDLNDREKIYSCDIADDRPNRWMRNGKCGRIRPLSRCHDRQLLTHGAARDGPAQDGSPIMADINAGGYVWMSLDVWVSMTCCTDRDTFDRFFTQNPP